MTQSSNLKIRDDQSSYKTVTEWEYLLSTLLPKALIIAKQRKNSFRSQESEVLINWIPYKDDVKLPFSSFYPPSIKMGKYKKMRPCQRLI